MPRLTPCISILIVFVGWEAACAWPLPAKPLGIVTESPGNFELARRRHRYGYNEESDKPRGPMPDRDETFGFGSLLRPFTLPIRPEGRRNGRWVDPPPPR
jgi:hypothetical protein